ncbi:MAG: hypothetical protein ACJ71T_14145 [Actinomycetales bacterium]
MQGAALVEQQHGVVSIDQVAQLGLTKDQVRHRVRRGSWRRLYPRVFATHAGDLDFQARVWAAVLAAGPTAMASHATAGRLQGLVDDDPDQIELTVGLSSPGHDRPGVRLRRSPAASARRHPARLPPQTRIEDTVLDLVAAATTPDGVVTWVLRACQRRLTTPARLAGAAEGRQRLRNRALFEGLVQDAAGGVASALELRYRSDVEVAHGLPPARRNQVWTAPDGRRRYFDVRYDEWRVRIELEGLAYHPADRSRWDAERDNAAVLMGDVVLRYGWHPVVRDPCAVAAQVCAVLTLRGWTGGLARCSPQCRAVRA